MNKTKIEIIKDICNIPVDFHEMGTISVYDLTKQSGYFENHNSISIEDIKNYLSQNTNLANVWLQYSEDKRTSSGWYFKKDDNRNIFIVGHFPGSDKLNNTEYSSKINACANFIIKELEDIRKE